MKALSYPLLLTALIHAETANFPSDAAFLSEHTDIITLSLDSGASVLVAPAWQGRVMTSTYDDKAGPSFGWINRKIIPDGVLPAEKVKGTLREKIYVFGGEERFWLGPEGGQFSYYFEPDAKFDFANWNVPAVIDTEAFEVADKSATHATFTHECELKNQSGFTFHMGIKRKVEILAEGQMEKNLSVDIPEGVKEVGYETTNEITNNGKEAWTTKTGMPSVWILGMYAPAPNTTVVIPIKDAEGPKVNDAYFGKIPAEYLQSNDTHIFMKGDGTRRGKIGITPARTMGIAGSYDADGKVLNIVTYTPQEAPEGYVNSMWEIQEEPFSGDVINAYNDGSPEPGAAPLGPFYEIETSSPAAALAPNETLVHKQQTYHLHGTEEELDAIAKKLLKVSLADITTAF